jgi:hypothetical protein
MFALRCNSSPVAVFAAISEKEWLNEYTIVL